MKQYGILANPARHSLSPVMFNAAFKAMKIDAQYGFFEIEEKDLSDFMERVKHEPINGLSVSLPYKEVVGNFLNVIDDDAKAIGAINTVHNKGGFLYGYNTDFIGFSTVLKESIGNLNDKVVVVLGGGGAAKAACYGALSEGAHVWVKNRTKSKADQIAIEFAEMFDSEIHSDEWDNYGTGDVLINATSIWIKNPDISDDDLPYFCDEDFLQEFEAVMDMTYTPLMTPLLKTAEGLGKKIITGDKMLLHQAVEQFEIWTGEKAPVEVMREALNQALL